MTTHSSVKDAHDALLRDFPAMAHEPCAMCVSTEKAEEAAVSDDKTYTTVEHAAILETEVARQTAELRVAKEDLESREAAAQEKATALEAEKADLLSKVDVLEAEKAAETARAEAAEKKHEDYLAAQTAAEELETRKTERVEAVKAALADADDSYFTGERIARWAELSAEHFDALLADLKESSAFKPKDDKNEDEDEKEKARETAAFRGGAEVSTEGKPSTAAAVLNFGRNRPAASA